MSQNDDNIQNDRTGGTSDACANPPVVLSLKQIIDKLESSGVDCCPEPATLLVLQRISFHRLKQYINAYKEYSTSQTCNMKQVHDLVTFDRRISAAALKYIGVLETEVKARYTQIMAEAYGPFSWYDKSLFLRERRHTKTISNINNEIDHQITKGNKRLEGLAKEYNGMAPIWDVSEYASFGSVSQLYANTADPSVTKEVATFFNVGKDRLSSWLRTLNDVRNVCAHFQPYIIRRQIPSIPKKDEAIPVDNASPFYVFPMLATLLSDKREEVGLDFNLDYSGRVVDEYARLLSDYLCVHRDMTKWISGPLDPDWLKENMAD